MTIKALYPSTQPSLSLDFANVENLDPRITFARASTARYYNGVTTAKAEENLLLQSQAFDTGSWIKGNATVTANTVAAPDGTTTADTLLETVTTGPHGMLPSPLLSLPAGTFTFSCFIKANGRTAATLVLSRNANNVHVAAVFDLSGGAVTQTMNIGAGFTHLSSSITESPAGSGWYRCVLTGSVPAATDYLAGIYVSDSTTYTPDTIGRNSYAGDITKGLFLWGAQLEQRSAVTAYTPTTTQPITNYVPVLLSAANNVARFDHNPVTGESLGLLIEEQRTNLQVQSEDFTTSWVVAAASIQSNTLVAPNGTLTADKLVEDTANAWHYVGFFNITPTTATPYTLSCYAKKGEREFVQLYLPSTAFGDSNATNGAVFDLTTGAIAVQGSALTSASITSVGNGWYRCTITKTSTSTTAFPFVVSVRNAGTFSTAGYTGDGYSGLFLWGAQLEAGAFPTSYIPTVASQVTRSADAASMTGADFSSWYRADEGTAYVEAASLATAYNASTLTFSDGTLNNRIVIRGMNTASQSASIGAVNNVAQWANIFAGQTAAATKWALGYRVNDTAFTRNAATPLTDADALIPVVNQLRIGADGDGTLTYNGHIRKLSYYPKRLADAQLQALTT
jgi:hypothetical protein